MSIIVEEKMNFTFLRHPKPYKDESLANYFYRLSKENYCDSSWILQEFGFRNISNRINFIESKDLINKIAYSTKLSPLEVIKMTFNNFHSNYEIEEKKYFNKHLTNKTYYCPLCLKANHFQRIYWTYDSIEICLEHKTILINRCQNCNSPIIAKSLITGYCTCGFYLESAIPIKCNDDRAINNQTRLYIGLNIIQGQIFENISRIEYIKLLDFLEIILKPFYNYKQNGYKYFVEIEKILENWPSEFYKALDSCIMFYKLHLKNRPSFFNERYIWSIIELINQEYKVEFLSKELDNLKKWYFSDRICKKWLVQTDKELKIEYYI